MNLPFSSINPVLNFLKANRAFNKLQTVVAADGSGDYLTLSTAISAGKKHIYLKAGSYTETSDIAISGVSIRGESPELCNITFTNARLRMTSPAKMDNTGTASLTNSSDQVVGVGSSFNSVTGSNIWFFSRGFFSPVLSIQDATSLTLAYTYKGVSLSTQSYCLISFNSQNSIIENIKFNVNHSSAGSFLTIEGAFNLIQNCEFFDTNSNQKAISTYYAANTGTIFNVIQNNKFINFSNPIYLVNAPTSIVINNAIQNCSSSGIILTKTAGDTSPDNSILIDNSISGCTQYGIYGYDTDDLQISNNVISDCILNSIYLEKCQYANVNSNKITSCNGINIYNNSYYANVIANMIFSPSSYGIQLSTYCDTSNITGNSIFLSITYGIVVINTDRNIISSNIIYASGSDSINIDSSCNHYVVSNNMIYASSADGIDCSADRTNIVSNNVEQSVGTGIIIQATADRCAVVGNISYQNGVANYTDNGTNTEAAHNVIA